MTLLWQLLARGDTWHSVDPVDSPGLVECDEKEYILSMINKRMQAKKDRMPIMGTDEPPAPHLWVPF